MQSSPEQQGFALPDVVNPDTSICFQVNVPNDPGHLKAFMGVMYDLTLWISWQRDPLHKGVQAAQVWKAIWFNLVGQTGKCPIPVGESGGTFFEDCDMQLQLKPSDPCIIQMWCIDHWEDWYNPASCIAAGAGQQGPQSPPAPGDSKEQCFQVPANGTMILPWTVAGGDTIVTSGAEGGWNDGGIIWYCPNGGLYALGACGLPSAPVGTDPLPTAPHMRIIGHLMTTGEYFDAFNATYVVPSSYAPQDVEFLCNDSSHGDDFGSISLCVQTTHNAGEVHLISNQRGIIINRGVLSTNVVRVGDHFTFTLASQPPPYPPQNPYDGYFQADQNLTLQIVSVTNWTPGTGWQWFDPPTGFAGAPTVGASQSTSGFAGNAITQGIVEFVVVSIP